MINSQPPEQPHQENEGTILNPHLVGAQREFGYFLDRIDQLNDADWHVLLGEDSPGEIILSSKFLDELEKKLLVQATMAQRHQVEQLIAALRLHLPEIQEQFIDLVDDRFNRLRNITAVHTDIEKLGTWHAISRQVLKQVLARVVRQYVQPLSATAATPNFWPRRAEQADQNGKETTGGDEFFRIEATSFYEMGDLEAAAVEQLRGKSETEQLAACIHSVLQAAVTFQQESNLAGVAASRTKKKRRGNLHISPLGPVVVLLIKEGKPFRLEFPVDVVKKIVPAHSDIVHLLDQTFAADPPTITPKEWERLYDTSLIPDSEKQRKDKNLKALLNDPHGRSRKKVDFVVSTGTLSNEDGYLTDPYDSRQGILTFGKNTKAHFRFNKATAAADTYSHMIVKAGHSWLNGMPTRDLQDIVRAELMTGQFTHPKTIEEEVLGYQGNFYGTGIELDMKEDNTTLSKLHLQREFFYRQSIPEDRYQQVLDAWREIKQKFKKLGISITPQDLIAYSIAMNLHRNIHVIRAHPKDGTLLDVPMLAASSRWMQHFYEYIKGKPLEAISPADRTAMIQEFVLMMKLFSTEKKDAESCTSLTAVFAELSGATFEETTKFISGLLSPELKKMVTDEVGGMFSAFVDGAISTVEARKKVMATYLIEKLVNIEKVDSQILFNVIEIEVSTLRDHIQQRVGLSRPSDVIQFINQHPSNKNQAVSYLLGKIKERLIQLPGNYSQVDVAVFQSVIEKIFLENLEDLEVTTANPAVYGYNARDRYLHGKQDAINHTHQAMSEEPLFFEQGGVFSASMIQGAMAGEVPELCVRMRADQYNPDRLTEHIVTILVNKGVEQGKVIDDKQYSDFHDQLLQQLKELPGFRQGLVEYLLTLSDFSNPDGYRQKASQALFKIGESCFSRDSDNNIAYILKVNLGLRIGRAHLNDFIQEAMNLYAQEEVQRTMEGLYFLTDILLSEEIPLSSTEAEPNETPRSSRRWGRIRNLLQRRRGNPTY